MESKKTNKANLENKRTMFLEIGLIVSMTIVLVSFEWNSSTKDVDYIMQSSNLLIDDETVPITQQEPPPPPENIPEPLFIEKIQIVDNDVKVDYIEIVEEDAPIKIVPYIEKRYVEEEVEEDTEIPFAIIEEKPTFQGHDANAFTVWVYNNIVYPDLARENGIQGRVVVEFTIDKDGSVKNVKVVRGVDSSLNNEAVRVINKSPKWAPGKQRGKPTRVKYTFPIHFKLQ